MLYGIMLATNLVSHMEHERKTVEAARASMTEADFDAWYAARKARHAAEAEEAKAERRHQELCEAIRSTSFWRLGR